MATFVVQLVLKVPFIRVNGAVPNKGPRKAAIMVPSTLEGVKGPWS